MKLVETDLESPQPNGSLKLMLLVLSLENEVGTLKVLLRNGILPYIFATG